MKIQFDSSQQYQLDAIQSVLDIFEGQPHSESQRTMRLDAPAGNLFSDLFISNRLFIDEERISENIKAVQERNKITNGAYAGRHFSVEMETGTGKTYVYLRTIYELHERYGFTKFVIVVPSVAIREGVMKAIEMTRDHFQDIYQNKPVDPWVYDSKQISRLRDFSSKNTLQILIINIDAFNKKDIAVIHKEQDRMSGRRPIEYIQAVLPIVIMDEPQNMESEKAKEAISSLNPLCTLRYSATHKDVYNLVYKLDPVMAYDLGLVKRIEVDSVLEQGDFNKPFIQLHKTNATKTRISAQVTLDVKSSNGTARKKKAIKHGDDLAVITDRELYLGFVVSEIHHGDGYVDFTNGHRLYVGDSIGGQTDDLMRVQIQETVKSHFDNDLKLKRQLPNDEKMKVLSLFFIDRVSNYADQNGKIRLWFEEAYKEISSLPRYTELKPLPVEKVHNGYFARDKNGKAKDTRGDTQADDDAYELIMKDKERLLSPEVPLRFIFSHSALREGWDNPNVFQICTLNETRSEMKKRQEIGRGL
ncbi:MAG TPA: DEAD/DEAH box helicase family protein, partial [Chitinophagaceae bacterium]|nr:DEAD/DEAH box helicase family protein [Chitinophagaceae bacterium]